ncbi:cation:proton antiporter [Acuticoccus sp. I52.16.1]|uniref:cation:proton antiporter n=1 Tax=Acuticoccus sp. I52.16.1 TaxID=2928472 RepID=UPI001FD1C746|nr:cation:proton antiporter [Acuticoccus sp. I52.16.1]UOM34345.1 cation:proton antiporter [Acuticoccus sp. I52.16.1]
MTGEGFLQICYVASLAMLSVAIVLIVVRIVIGPSLPDRVLALDLLVNAAVGFIIAFGIRTGFSIYVDIAIALGLVGFLSTVALARFLHRRGDISIHSPTMGRKGDAP